MKAGSIILAVVLLGLAAGALGTAQRLATNQQRAAEARAALPPLPDVAGWPAGFDAELQRCATAVRRDRNPVAALAGLTRLCVANNLAATAASLLATLERLEPENARWPYLEAELRLRAGDYVAAQERLRVAMELAPDYAPGWLRLGDVQLREQAVEAAYQSYVRASHVANDVRAQVSLARLQAETGTRGDPRPRLATLARGYPELKDLHQLLAYVLAAAGEHEQAAHEQQLANAADHRMETPDPWLDELAVLTFDPGRLGGLAAERTAQGRLAEAEILLRRAVGLAPNDARFREDLALVLHKLERETEARNVLTEAVAACPHDRGLRVRLASALRAAHKPADAFAVARQALIQWPRSATLQAEVGFALRELGENEAAAGALRAAVQLGAAEPEVRYALAYSLLALRRTAEARAEAEAALALRPDYAQALVMLGGIAVDAGDRATAETIVGRLRELRPDDPGSRLLVAGLQLMKGQAAEAAGELDEAARQFREGLAAAPDFAPLLRESGLLSVRRGHFPEAVELFERYMRIERRDLRAYVWLGDALEGCERQAEARDIFERGLALAQKADDRVRITELSTRLER